MADQPSIFNQENSGTPPQNNVDNSNINNAPNDTELTHLLQGIKNERGEPKYKTLKDAIVGLQNAQEYIPDLKKTLADKDQEIIRLREEANRVATLEDTVRKLTEQSSNLDSPSKSLTAQEIADLVNRSLDTTLTQREIVKTQKQNLELVVGSLTAAFGADAEKKFYDKATELGMSVADFNALAAKSPKMVLSTLGVTEKAPIKSASPTQGTVNSQGFLPRSETFVSRNNKPSSIGATTKDLLEEGNNSRKMIEELHSKGMSIKDLTDPKVYAKYFG